MYLILLPLSILSLLLLLGFYLWNVKYPVTLNWWYFTALMIAILWSIILMIIYSIMSMNSHSIKISNNVSGFKNRCFYNAVAKELGTDWETVKNKIFDTVDININKIIIQNSRSHGYALFGVNNLEEFKEKFKDRNMAEVYMASLVAIEFKRKVLVINNVNKQTMIFYVNGEIETLASVDYSSNKEDIKLYYDNNHFETFEYN